MENLSRGLVTNGLKEKETHWEDFGEIAIPKDYILMEGLKVQVTMKGLYGVKIHDERHHEKG